MELVYLSNGQACYLKEKLGEKFIVNKVFEHEQFFGEDSEMVEFIDENDIVVDVVFKTPPVPKFSSEVSELIKKKDELQQEVRLLNSERSKLSNEVAKLTTTKITKNKFILNKTELINAKTLALFSKDRIMPKVMESKDKSFAGLKVSMETRINSTDENYWGYKLYYDEGYTSGDFLCPKYGILINPTESEIDETIKKRLLEFKFPDRQVATIDDKYLTQSQIDTKNVYLSNLKAEEKEKLDKQLVEIQEKLKKFDTVSSAV
jgi:hypothetical protein